MPTPPELDKLELATGGPAPQAPLEGYTFEGFRNPDGSVGTKNVLAISTSVQCVAGTLQFAIKRIKAELLPKYPNVDDVVGLTHNYGCGVAIIGAAGDRADPHAAEPRAEPELRRRGDGGRPRLREAGSRAAVPGGADDDVVRMQDEAFDGFGAMVDAIMEMAEARLAVLEPPPARDLSRHRPGRRPAVRRQRCVLRRYRQSRSGLCADLLVRAGATVMFSEVTEVRDAIHLLTRRAVNAEVAAR